MKREEMKDGKGERRVEYIGLGNKCAGGVRGSKGEWREEGRGKRVSSECRGGCRKEEEGKWEEVVICSSRQEGEAATKGLPHAFLIMTLPPLCLAALCVAPKTKGASNAVAER